MKLLNFTSHRRRATLQTLRYRKLLLDRVIRELESLVSKRVPASEEPLLPAVPFDEASERWLQ